MGKESKIIDRLVIQKAKFREGDIGYILLTLAVIILVENIITKLILLATIFGFVFYIFKRRLNNKEQIVIDKEGITLRCNDINRSIQWKDIKHAYIKQTTVGALKVPTIIYRLHVETVHRRIYTVIMNGFSYKSSLLNQCINHFSGKKIGHISDKSTEVISLLLNDKDLADKTYLVFCDYLKRFNNIWMYSFLTLIPISLILVVILDFPHTFAIGGTVSYLILLILNICEENRLRNHRLFRDLDSKKFEKLINEYGKEFEYDTYTPKTRLVILALIVIFMSVMSYMSSK